MRSPSRKPPRHAGPRSRTSHDSLSAAAGGRASTAARWTASTLLVLTGGCAHPAERPASAVIIPAPVEAAEAAEALPAPPSRTRVRPRFGCGARHRLQQVSLFDASRVQVELMRCVAELHDDPLKERWDAETQPAVLIVVPPVDGVPPRAFERYLETLFVVSGEVRVVSLEGFPEISARIEEADPAELDPRQVVSWTATVGAHYLVLADLCAGDSAEDTSTVVLQVLDGTTGDVLFTRRAAFDGAE